MGILNTGVSGGVAVTSQNTGVSLSLLNDYGYILPSNAAPTPGPDTQGLVTVSGTYGVGALLSFEKCLTPADFTAGNWTPLYGVLLRSNGSGLASGGYTIALAVNQSLDLAIPAVQGLYAIRIRLSTAPASGAVIVSGTTFPAAAGAENPAVLAAYQQLTTYAAALALALSDMNGTDYLAGVGGSF